MKRRNQLSEGSSTTVIDANGNDLFRSSSANTTQEILFWNTYSQREVFECYRSPYIEYGYRKPASLLDTFMTLFSVHNETMSIWSHLIGFVCVVVAGFNVSYDLLSSYDYSLLEVVSFGSFIFCASLCLLLSSMYHWFGCYSEGLHVCLLRLDVTGIGLLVSGSYFPGVYYGFYCNPEVQLLHWGLTLLVFFIGVSAPFIDWKINNVPVRPYVLASLVVVGFVPFAHWLCITPALFMEEVVREFLLMFSWYGVGFFFFVTKIPERYFSNR
jgi:adiponectin receptor